MIKIIKDPRFISIALLAATLCLVDLSLVGCSTPQQRVAYNTIFTVEQTASAAVDGYYAAVIKGLATTNEVPQVSQAYNHLQIACTIAASTTEAGTNVLAPANINIELVQLTNLIASLMPK